MSNIIINLNPTRSLEELIAVCPFNAIEKTKTGLQINAGCKMCRICIKKFPEVFTLNLSEPVHKLNRAEWQGIAVFIEHFDGCIHPVSLELIGKAHDLAKKAPQPIIAMIAGEQISYLANQALEYGVNTVFAYDASELRHFRIEPFTAIFEDFINRSRPSTILVGGTSVGRSLAPRVAARFKTGLTADCTILNMNPNTDLDQIRPAYGGNIMAHIQTPNHRPQFATVRYKIFNSPSRTSPTGKVVHCQVAPEKLVSAIEIIETRPREKVKSLEDAEVIVVAGKGIKKAADLNMIYELADSLKAMTAVTRPLIEQGWADPRLQIGLSGRTVKPQLIITCGVSGSVQFAAGMQGADHIMAINTDAQAPIFNMSHYAIVGDIYQVIPMLLEKIRKGAAVV